MAAPIGAYRNKSFFMNKSGVDYEHLTAILQEGDAIHKERFYLDELFVIRLEDGTDGVIGMVAEGSENEAMHNLTTRGGVGRAYKGGRVVRMLNDAGLNTLGRTTEEIVVSSYPFDMRISAVFNSAYYVDSSSYGFRARQRNNNNTDWEPWVYQYINTIIPEKNIVSETSQSFTTNRLTSNFQIEAFITNSEGTFYAIPLLLQPEAKSITFYIPSGVFYIDTDVVTIGTKLFDGSDFSGYHEGPTSVANYWIDNRFYWKYGYDVLSNTYMFLELVDSNPPIPITPRKLHYEAYSDLSQNDANNDVLNNNPNRIKGDIYEDSEGGTWHKSYSGTYPNFVFGDLSEDGYYADGSVGGVDREFHTISGIMIYEH